jgi:hypothetical protein
VPVVLWSVAEVVTAAGGDERLQATLDRVEAKLDRFGERVAADFERVTADSTASARG